MHRIYWELYKSAYAPCMEYVSTFVIDLSTHRLKIQYMDYFSKFETDVVSPVGFFDAFFLSIGFFGSATNLAENWPFLES